MHSTTREVPGCGLRPPVELCGDSANGVVSGAIQATPDGSKYAALEKTKRSEGISDQTGAPQDITQLLGDPKTAQEGFRRMARWGALLITKDQILFEDVPYFRTEKGRLAAARTNMETGEITFSRAATGDGDFWVALSNVRHEYGHWLDWRFSLGDPDTYEVRVQSVDFARTPGWYQDGIKKQLKIEEDTYICKERGTC